MLLNKRENKSTWSLSVIRLIIVCLAAIFSCKHILLADMSHSNHDDAELSDYEFTKKDDHFEYSTTISVSAERPDEIPTIIQLPAFVTVVHIEPDTPRFLTLPEILAGTVGVTVKDFGGLGSLSTVSIRGTSANQVIVLIDGIRINTASDSGVDLSTLPLTSIEKIEVLRGADSAVFGSGAMGGVINLVTRKHQSDGWSGDGSLTYASWNTAIVNFNTSLNNQYTLSGSWRHSDGDFTFTNDNGTEFNPNDDYQDRRKNNDSDAFDASFRFRAFPSETTTLSGNIEGFIADKGIPGLTTFPSPHASQTDRRLTGYLRWEKNLDAPVFKRLYIESHGKYLDMNFSDPKGEQTGVPVETDQQTQFVSGQAGFNFSYGKGSGDFGIVTEKEVLHDADFGKVERVLYALNCRHEMMLFNGKFWLTSMLRYDSFSDAGDYWSPKIGLHWSIKEGLSVKTNAGYGFRAPSFNELYFDAGFIASNPDLKPEEAFSFDIGLTVQKSKWRFEAAWFSIDSTDLIQYQLVSGFRYKPYNVGRARSQGIELDGAVLLGKGFSISGSYTWDKAIDRSNEPNHHGKQIPGRPEHDLFGKLTWNKNPFSVWTEWHHLSGNYITRSNTKKLDARLTGNLGVTYDLSSTWRFGVEVKNISNYRMLDVRGFPLPSRSWFATIKLNL